MYCSAINETISEYIDGTLSNSENHIFEEHILACENCRQYYEHIKQIVDATAALPEIELPDGFREQVMRAVRIEATTKKDKTKIVTQNNYISLLRFKKSYIFAGATAACLALALLFIVLGGGARSGGSKYYSEAQYAGEAAAPMAAAPMAPAAEAPMAPMNEEANYGKADNNMYENGMASYDIQLQEEPMRTGAEAEQAEADMVAGASGIVYSDGGSTSRESEPSTATVQKIIKTVNYDIEVTEFDASVAKIQEISDITGGFIENFSTYVYDRYFDSNGSRDLKSGYICLRVPQNEYGEAKIKLGKLGKIMSTSEYIENITSMYVDMAARLEVKKAEEQRLLELYARADKIEDLIALETRLTYVRQDIEGMIAQLGNWDRSVSFSTINISIREVVDYSQIQPVDPTLGEKIHEGVNRSIAAFTRGVERAIIGIAENSVAILVFLVFIVILWSMFVILKRRRDKNDV